MQPGQTPAAQLLNIEWQIGGAQVVRAEEHLPPRNIVAPVRRPCLGKRDDRATAEVGAPGPRVEAVPAPVSPPGAPLLLNGAQGRREAQPAAGGTAGVGDDPLIPGHRLRLELRVMLLHLPLCQDREVAQVFEGTDLLRGDAALLKAAPVVWHGLSAVANE